VKGVKCVCWVFTELLVQNAHLNSRRTPSVLEWCTVGTFLPDLSNGQRIGWMGRADPMPVINTHSESEQNKFTIKRYSSRHDPPEVPFPFLRGGGGEWRAQCLPGSCWCHASPCPLVCMVGSQLERKPASRVWLEQ